MSDVDDGEEVTGSEDDGEGFVEGEEGDDDDEGDD
jgi:hypothetical protein